MSYPVWPENLQARPLVDGFTASGAQPVKRQQMETGLDRVTRLSSTTVRTNVYSIICTKEQLADFWSFYENEANQGADLVQMPMITGNETLMHLCRFASYPREVPDGLEWRVTFELETDEQHIDWGF